MPISDLELDLDLLGGGAAAEKFDLELKRVLANIGDINTKDGEREIVLRFKFKPDDNREHLAIDISSGCRLQPLKPYRVSAVMERAAGRFSAYEITPHRQLPLPNNVTPIERKEANLD